MGLSGIITITNSNVKSASSRKIPLGTFTLAKVSPLAFDSTVQFFIATMMNFITFSHILYILDCLVFSFAGIYPWFFCSQFTPWLHYSYYYNYYLTPLEFFTSELADGSSLEFEWQQVSSNLQNSSQDFGRSYQCCRLDSLYLSANFQVLQASSKVEVLILLFTFLQIYSVVRRDSKVYNFADSLFFFFFIRSGLLAGIRWSVCILKSHRSLWESFSRTGAGLCIYLLLLLFTL